MHRFLAIGLAVMFALALCGEAAAWSWPADGAVLRPFALGADVYAGGQHRGVDVAGPDGSPVRAPASGVVTFAGSLPTYGRGVTILTADGYAVTLVHLGAIGVSKGETVSEGAAVGTMGTSGTPEQAVPSVHLGIRRAAEEEGYLDPLGLLPPRATAVPASPPAAAPSPAPVAAATPAVAPSPAPVAALPAPAPASPPTSVAAPAVASVSAAPSASAAPSVAAPAAPDPAAQTAANQVAGGPAPADDAAVGATAPGVVLTAPAARRSPADAARASVVVQGGSRPVVRAPVPPAPAGTRTTGTAIPRHAGSADEAPAFARDPAGGGTRNGVGTRPEGVAHNDARDPADGRSGSMLLAETRKALEPPSAHPAAQPVPTHARRAGRSGAVRVAAGGARGPGIGLATAGPRGSLGLPELAAALALAMLAAVAVGRRVARRIGMDGAVLRHDADLLRQLDAAHRARVHDRGRGRVRAPSAAART